MDLGSQKFQHKDKCRLQGWLGEIEIGFNKGDLERPNETFNEAWEHFKDLLRQCPHHGFSDLHKLDTFYNALNPNDQDALDSAAGGNFLDKIPREYLSIIESKSKQIAASLEDKLDIRMNRFEKSLNDMKASFITPTAPIKAVEEDSDSHREEIDVVTEKDDVLPPSIENDDSDGEVDAVGDLRVDNSIQNSKHEYSESEDSDFDNTSVPLPPPEPPDEEFDFEFDFGNEISVVKNTIVKFECIDARVKFDVFNDENDDLSYFMFVKSLTIQCGDISSIEKVEQINKIDFIDAGGRDFDSEEIEIFLNDDSIPLGVEDSPFNMDEDILFLKKSSTKNLIPIPHESEVVSNDGSKSIKPVKDDSLVFTTISNPLFDNDELNSYVESNSDESTSNHDTVKFDNLDEFSGPVIPIHIVEEERIRREHADYINRMEMLFTINPRPHPSTYANSNVEFLSSLPIPIQDSDSHQEEIDVVTQMDDVLPPSIKNDDSDGEVDAIDDLRVDNSISNSEHEFFESEDSDFDNPSVPLPPPEPPDEEFDFEKDFENEISVVRNTIVKFECIDARVKFDVFNDENDDLSYFMFVKVFSLLSAESEDTILDPGISN
nr:reverse transcriptase domain-containing protein [Tanacetum cinerariifolium]